MVPMTREHRGRRIRRTKVPQLHCVISDCGREDVLHGGVPEYLTDLARRRVDVQHGRKVDGNPALRVPALELHVEDRGGVAAR